MLYSEVCPNKQQLKTCTIIVYMEVCIHLQAKVTELLQESPQIREENQSLQFSSHSTESITPNFATLSSVITPHMSCVTSSTSPAGSVVSDSRPLTGALTDLSLLPVPRIV